MRGPNFKERCTETDPERRRRYSPAGALQITMDFTEQRKHPRGNVDLFADWGRSAECEYYDRVTSLSLSGCFLATRRELNRGDEIYIRLREETVGAVNVKGAIRYQLRVMEGAAPTGAGVEFVGVSAEAQTKLQLMMNSCQQAS